MGGPRDRKRSQARNCVYRTGRRRREERAREDEDSSGNGDSDGRMQCEQNNFCIILLAFLHVARVAKQRVATETTAATYILMIAMMIWMFCFVVDVLLLLCSKYTKFYKKKSLLKTSILQSASAQMQNSHRKQFAFSLSSTVMPIWAALYQRQRPLNARHATANVIAGAPEASHRRRALLCTRPFSLRLYTVEVCFW